MPDPKQAFYFSHDSNARNDIKIVKLRRKHGMRGYGAYWGIIEILREEATMRMNISCIDDVAFQLNEPIEFINEIINSFDLFKIDGNQFYSDSLIRRMAIMNEIKQKLSDAGKKGMANRWGNKDHNGAPPLRKAE